MSSDEFVRFLRYHAKGIAIMPNHARRILYAGDSTPHPGPATRRRTARGREYKKGDTMVNRADQGGADIGVEDDAATTPRAIRLIACDLDGTLLRPDGTVSPRVAARVQDLARAGVVFVIATGRSWRTALRVQADLGITGPLVAHNGAYAYDSATRREIYAHRVPRAAARAMLAWATPRRIMLRWYLGVGQPVLFNFFTEEHLARFLRPEDTAVPELHRTLAVDPLEIFLFGTWEVDAFLARFGTRGPGYEAVVFPHDATREINVCAPGADKVEGVAAVARHLGIPPSDILVLGDGANDIRLMRWAGVAVAMGHGHQEAMAVADYVTPADAADPVLDALDWAWNQAGRTRSRRSAVQ
jgi:Cof subfamily protein (haloacid dehalogenase superfamily)